MCFTIIVRIADSVPHMWEKFSQRCTAILKENLCADILMIHLIHQFPAPTARREYTTIFRYSNNRFYAVLSGCEHRGYRSLLCTETERAWSIKTDTSVYIPLIGNQCSSNASTFRIIRKPPRSVDRLRSSYKFVSDYFHDSIVSCTNSQYHSGMEAFTIEHASVRRDGKYILEDVSLHADMGEHIAIIGPNGAGKSTLIDVIARRTYPLALDEYRSSILGEERWMIQDLKMRISLVSPSQDEFFTSAYPAREIVASGLYSSLGFDFHHAVKDEDWVKADRELEKTGMLMKKDRTMNTLSTGEKRRVLLARAAITEPDILLLDEASSGLDFPSRADLRGTIESYATGDRTIVMVTHELSEILPSINRVILMKNGKIAADGKKEDLIRSDILSDLYGRKVSVAEKDGIFTAFC